MSKKLYVGNLPFSLTEDRLHQLFAEQGQVSSARLITDRYTGQSKGFGFVEMPNDEDANKAIAALNNMDVDGRKIVVNEARPMEKRPDGPGGRKPFQRRSF